MPSEILMDWSRASWPSLAGVKTWAGDTETTGLKQTDRAVSASFAFEDRESLWFAWGHDTGNNCTMAEFNAWATRELNRPDVKKIFHNAQFDARMLHSAGFTLNLDNIEDTGIIAPLLDERVDSFGLDFLSKEYLGEGKHDDQPLNEWCAAHFKGRVAMKNQVRNYHHAPGHVVAPYGVKDAELTLRLYHAMRPKIDEDDELGHNLARVYDVETRLIPILVMMNRVGFRADEEAALDLQADIAAMIQAKSEEWIERTNGVNVNSQPQMAKLFTGLGFNLPLTDGGAPSTSAAVLSGLDHPLADLAVDIRKLGKFSGTFVRNYILNNITEEGLIHGQFHQLKKEDQRGSKTGTVSGRFSSSGGLNLQNLPATDPDKAHTLKHQLSERVRGCFVPYYRGGTILSVDYSQIEFRIIAHYAGGALRREYLINPDVDFHEMVAKLTGIHRKPAKNINFGLAYGMGIKLMAERLGVPFDEAKRMLMEYHDRLPEVNMIYNQAMRRASSRGYIRTLLDRKRRFYEDPERRYGPYKSTHKALNALAQGGGADIMKQAMVDCADIYDWKETLLHATVHDEIVATVPEGPVGEEIIAEIQHRMEMVGEKFNMTVPLRAECKIGRSWGTAKRWRRDDGQRAGLQPRPDDPQDVGGELQPVIDISELEY